MLPGVAVVITPLIALMKDQVENLRKRHVAAVGLWQGVSDAARKIVYDELEKPKPSYKLLFATPEGVLGGMIIAHKSIE
jgi:superfamily II DNA helicase RecQ